MSKRLILKKIFNILPFYKSPISKIVKNRKVNPLTYNIHRINESYSNIGYFSTLKEDIFKYDKNRDYAFEAKKLTNEGLELLYANRLEEAKDKLFEALYITKREVGLFHSSCTSIMTHIAHVFIKLNKIDDAFRVLEDVIKIRYKLYGPFHLSIVATLKAYVQVLIHIKQYPQVLFFCLVTNFLLLGLEMQIYKKYGKIENLQGSTKNYVSHMKLTIESERAYLLNTKGFAAYQINNEDMAKENWLMAFKKCKSLIPYHKEKAAEIMIVAYKNLLYLSKKKNDLSNAINLCNDLINTMEKYLPESKFFPNVLNQTASLYERSQNYEMAVKMYEKALVVLKSLNEYSDEYRSTLYLLEEAKKKNIYSH